MVAHPFYSNNHKVTQVKGAERKISIMKNQVWRNTVLHKSDLPFKAQRFIDLLEIPVDKVTITLLEADLNGDYIKIIEGDGVRGRYEWEERVLIEKDGTQRHLEWLKRTIYLINKVKVTTTIHELMHFYIRDNKIDYQSIVEAYLMDDLFIKVFSLSSVGQFNWRNKHYEDLLCEIVATYGRRGQFGKIAELLNL